MTQTVQLDTPASPATLTIDTGASPVVIEYLVPVVQLDMSTSGPPGPQGGGGGSAVKQDIAAAGAISALRVLRTDATGDLVYCDADTAVQANTAVGISNTAVGGAGGDVEVITAGYMTDAAWTWTPGAPIFCGATGALTQNAATPTGFLQQIAVATSATEVVVSIETAVVKA